LIVSVSDLRICRTGARKPPSGQIVGAVDHALRGVHLRYASIEIGAKLRNPRGGCARVPWGGALRMQGEEVEPGVGAQQANHNDVGHEPPKGGRNRECTRTEVDGAVVRSGFKTLPDAGKQVASHAICHLYLLRFDLNASVFEFQVLNVEARHQWVLFGLVGNDAL